MFITEEHGSEFSLRISGYKETFDKDLKLWLKIVDELREHGEHPAYNSLTKIWTVKNTDLSRKLLNKVGALDLLKYREPKLKIVDPEIFDRKTLSFLRPYQKEALQYLEERDGVALIGDDMGIGKTAEAISYFILHKRKLPILVICPASVKEQWKEEFLRFYSSDLKILVCYGLDSLRTYTEYDVIIINYNIFSYHYIKVNKRFTATKTLKEFRATNFQGVILDECQAVKNRQAKSTKAIKYLTANIPHKIGLSGTPINNYQSEMFSILNILRPDLWHNWGAFVNRYSEPKCMGKFWTYKGARNSQELYEILRKFVLIRRSARDVLPDLPPTTIIPEKILLSDSARIEYGYIEESLKEWVNTEGKKLNIDLPMTRVIALQQFLSIYKKPYVADWIQRFIESTDEKLVVFCTSHGMVDFVKENFSDITLVLDGRTKKEDKNKIKNKFIQTKKYRILVGNVDTLGIGIDGLHKVCNRSLFAELPWTPSQIKQPLKRLERSGQEKSVIFAHFPIVDNSKETDIMKLLSDKDVLLGKVLDGDGAINILQEVTKTYRGK